MKRHAPRRSRFRRHVERERHNESAFRFFLAVDRRRAERWNRSLLVVLVALRRGVGGRATLTHQEAAALFAALSGCVRDIDILGWYKQDRLIAVILTQAIKVSPDVPRSIAQRISTAVSQCLCDEDAGRLRVRVVTLGNGREAATL